jgi:hypothetical protein
VAQEKFDSSEIIAVRRNLADALNDLKAFLDPDNDSCNVSREARTEAQEFLSSWVLGPIEAADQLIERRVDRNEIARKGARNSKLSIVPQ